MILSTKIKKRINVLLRIIIAILSVSFIYWQLSQSGNFSTFKVLIREEWESFTFQIYLLLAILSMPLNWGIEAYKWKQLIHFSERITLWHSFKSVFTGIAISLFTPNRVGEFLARALTLKHTPLIKGSLLTLVGNVSQLLTTLILGTIALIVFIPQYYPIDATSGRLIYAAIVLLSSVTVIVLISLFLKVSYLSGISRKLVKPEWQKIRSYLRVVRRLNRKFLLKILSLSIVRYIVFTTQYYLMLKAFGLNIGYADAVILISMVFLVMTSIPTIALVDIGIKGSVSIYFFNYYFNGAAGSSVSVLAASSLIWVINLAIPALIGLLFINRVKFIHK